MNQTEEIYGTPVKNFADGDGKARNEYCPRDIMDTSPSVALEPQGLKMPPAFAMRSPGFVISPARPDACSRSEEIATVAGSMGRKKRSPWTHEDDKTLLGIIDDEGIPDGKKYKWTHVAGKLNNNKSGKQCRERWQNHLRPDIKKGNWTKDEEFSIQQLYKAFGPKWAHMAKLMPQRTDNDIKNKWYSMSRRERKLRKKINDMRLNEASVEIPSVQQNVAASHSAGTQLAYPKSGISAPTSTKGKPKCTGLPVQAPENRDPQVNNEDSQPETTTYGPDFPWSDYLPLRTAKSGDSGSFSPIASPARNYKAV